MDREKLYEEIKADEGEVLEVYEDHLGYPTIGVGHLVTEKDEEFGEFWKLIHEEYLLTKKMLLKISNFKNLMENEPANKLSIETREEIVMPLITIQQYALQIVNEIDSNKSDNSKKPIFEKMITRSLYGNINASRNSA